MTSYKIAETMRELRIHSGMTQEELSKKLNISRQAYSYYESGRRLPDLETACRIAEYHHIGLEKLVITGLHADQTDPFATLPADYQALLGSYMKLSPEAQKSVRDFAEFLTKKKNN